MKMEKQRINISLIICTSALHLREIVNLLKRLINIQHGALKSNPPIQYSVPFLQLFPYLVQFGLFLCGWKLLTIFIACVERFSLILLESVQLRCFSLHPSYYNSKSDHHLLLSKSLKYIMPISLKRENFLPPTPVSESFQFFTAAELN